MGMVHLNAIISLNIIDLMHVILENRHQKLRHCHQTSNEIALLLVRGVNSHLTCALIQQPLVLTYNVHQFLSIPTHTVVPC
jgi:hypothetical protein